VDQALIPISTIQKFPALIKLAQTRSTGSSQFKPDIKLDIKPDQKKT